MKYTRLAKLSRGILAVGVVAPTHAMMMTACTPALSVTTGAIDVCRVYD